MNRILLVITLVLPLGIALPLAPSDLGTDRVLVLGFQTRHLTDIQRRLLRESVMRKLHERGFSVVPVMEMEEFIQGKGESFIGKVSPGELPLLCVKMKARWGMTGSITAVKGEEGETGIINGRAYRCRIYIADSRSRSFLERAFTLTGKRTLYEFFTLLSMRAAAAAAAVIK